jgi:hypothetical protein
VTELERAFDLLDLEPNASTEAATLRHLDPPRVRVHSADQRQPDALLPELVES